MVWIAAILVMLPLIATFGFMTIEGWGFLDSLYMSVITLSTVGYEHVHPVSDAGRIFIIFYVVVGLGIFLFGTAELGEAILRGELRKAMGRRKVDSLLKNMSDHFIVCGFGRMGSSLCRHLALEGKSFAIVDRDPERLDVARTEGWPTVTGDATDDTILELAGMQRAAGLAAVLPSDADNLYVVLSARLTCPDLMILARATDLRTDAKMIRAGATRVINLHEAGAHKMATLLTNPNLQDFMEVLAVPGKGLELAQFVVPEGAPYCGKRLDETDFQSKGLIIVGIEKKATGEFHLPPTAASVLDSGDVLTALGSDAGMHELLGA